MEVYLVKDKVQRLQVSKAFYKTKRYNGYIKGIQLDHAEIPLVSDDEPDDNGSQSPDPDDVHRTVLTLSDLPVTFNSTCNDVEVNGHSEQFAKRVEEELTSGDECIQWETMKLELITSNDQNSRDGYFLLSTQSTQELKFNVLRRLEENLGTDNLQFSVHVSLCHLPTKNVPVSPQSLVTLKTEDNEVYYSLYTHRIAVGLTIPVQVPREVMKWVEQGATTTTTTGFIYWKTSVKIRLLEKAVNFIYGYFDGNESLLEDGDFTDVEIGCKTRAIVRCHRVLLADKSSVLRRKLKGKEGGPGSGLSSSWKLKMEMSRAGVEAFKEYAYCGSVSGGLRDSHAALELLIAAREYNVAGLETAMGEIITGKGSSDFGYFSVEGALGQFLYARENMEELKYLRDKAVRVLQNYMKAKSEEMLKSKGYQDLFKNQPQVAMELSSLYMLLS